MAYQGRAIPSREITQALEEVLGTYDAIPEAITTQTLPYFITPNQVGLREVWMGMSDAGRQQVAQHFPQLAAAIHFMILGTVEGDQETLLVDDSPIATHDIPPVNPPDLPLMRGSGRNNTPETEEWLALEPSDVTSEEHQRWANHLRDLQNRPETLQ